MTGLPREASGAPRGGFPLGRAVQLGDLAGPDLHRVLAELRAAEPVSWLPVLDGWLVTRYDLATRVLRDAAVFLHMDATVDISKFKIVKSMFPATAGKYAGPEN